MPNVTFLNFCRLS